LKFFFDTRMKNFVTAFFIVAVVTTVLQLLLPVWWVGALVAAVVAFFSMKRAGAAFLLGFLAILITWSIYAFVIDVQSAYILTQKMDVLLKQLRLGMPIWLVSGLVGGIFGGMGGLTGVLLKKALRMYSIKVLSENLKLVQEEIRKTAEAAGKSAADVTLIAVSKTHPIVAVQSVFKIGQLHFGENRVQEMAEKQPLLPEAHWHQIGPLQTNKVKYIAPFVHLIHTLDSVKLLQEIEKQAAKCDRNISCLIQVNISDEGQKNGTTPEGAEEIVKAVSSTPHVRIEGLMGIAELTNDKAKIRGQFRSLRLLRDKLSVYNGAQIHMHHLSMGMSADLAEAIAEGATLVRVGSAIFGARG